MYKNQQHKRLFLEFALIYLKKILSLRKSLYVNRVTFCSVFRNLIISHFNVAFKWIHFVFEGMWRWFNS